MHLTASSWASGAETLRIAVISDINGRYGSATYHPRVAVAVRRLIAMEPDLVISTGDMVAGQRTLPPLRQSELDAMWDNFNSEVRLPLRKAGIPLLMTPGNHDASAYPRFARERDTFARQQVDHPPLLPPLPGGNYPFHYAVQFADILLVSLDATTIGPIDIGQRDWLKSLLEAHEDKRAVIVFGHLPLQPVSVGRELEIIDDPALASLLAATRNSIYLSGHHHAYYPGWQSGLHRLSVGNLGGNQRLLLGSRRKTGFSFAILDIDTNGQIDVTALAGPDFERAIAIENLPPQIDHAHGRLVRRDLAGTPSVD